MRPKRNLNKFEIQQIQKRVEKLASSLPKGISDYVFHAFKRRRIFSGNYTIKNITKRDLCFKESLLKKELAKESKRRHEQKFRLQNIHSTVHNSIQTSFVPTLKQYLEPKRLVQANRFHEYIEVNKLPASLLYNVIDFQQATGDKYLHLEPDELLMHIGTRYKSNIIAAYEGSTPKSGKTLYNTLPFPFSQLYFDMVKIISMVFPDFKLKVFEEHLLHLYNKEIKEVTYTLLHCRNEQELDNIINRLHNQINNSLWVPKQIKYKDKQMELYFKNKGFLKPEFLRILAHSYLKWKSNHGTNENLIKNLNPSDVISGMKNGLESCLKAAKKRARSGWTIFGTAPQRESYIYNELANVLRGLGGKVTPVSKRKTKITSCKRPHLKKYTIDSDLLYREATS